MCTGAIHTVLGSSLQDTIKLHQHVRCQAMLTTYQVLRLAIMLTLNERESEVLLTMPPFDDLGSVKARDLPSSRDLRYAVSCYRTGAQGLSLSGWCELTRCRLFSWCANTFRQKSLYDLKMVSCNRAIT